MSTPSPVPSQRSYRPRSVFGPLVLVTIGVLVLLRNMGVLSLQTFGPWFARYWPVLLIVWGVVKLIEYLWARQKGYATPQLGGGSIVFLIFFILFGVVATNSLDWDWPGIRGNIGDESDFDPGGWWGSSYDFTDTFAQPMSSPQQIKILGRRGNITVKASQDSQAHVVVEKSVRTESQSAADRVNESTHAKFEQQGNIWVLDLTNSNFSRGQYNLDLELPPGADLSVSTHIGDISVENRPGNLVLSTDHGDVTVEQVKGDANVSIKRGSLTAKELSGNLTLDGGNDVTVSEIGGTLNMSGSFAGEVQMSKIAKAVHFSTSRTDLQFARLDGELTMELNSLRASNIAGPFKLDTRSKTVHLEDLVGDLHIDDQNSVIEVQAKAPVGNMDISTVRGEIDLVLPPKSAFQLNAESVGGDIQGSDFNINVDNNRRTTTASTTVGKGGPTIRLKADRGSIQIRKSQ